MSIPDVSIVIVNFNQYSFTSQCLDSILENPPNSTYEIILVDNASSDGSADRLEAQYFKVKLVRSEKNLGIAGGNNLGIKKSDSRYVLLLNNDTIVIPGSIDRLVRFLSTHSEAAGVGGYLLNPDRSFQSGAMDFHTVSAEFLNITRLGTLIRPYWPSHPPCSEAREVDWMSTAFMLFRRDALESVGLVDERFFIYADESDLEYRLFKAGWKIFSIPDSEIIHFGGKSLYPWISRPLKYRGRLLFFIKHRNALDIFLVRIIFLISSLLKLGFWLLMFLIPSKRTTARLELSSHIKIFRLAIMPFDVNYCLPNSIRY